MLTLLLLLLPFGLLAFAHIANGARGHQVGCVGFLLFTMFLWGLAVTLFQQGIILDGIGVVAASCIPLFLSTQSWRTWKAQEEHRPLRWLYGVIGFTGSLFFFIERVPVLQAATILLTAFFVLLLLHAFGYSEYGFGDWVVERGVFSTNPLLNDMTYLQLGNNSGAGVNIIFACTALSGLIGIATAILCTTVDWKLRVRVASKVVGLIFAFNVVRIAILVLILHHLPNSRVGEVSMFDLVHHWLADLVLFGILFWALVNVYATMPELHTNIRRNIALLNPRTRPTWDPMDTDADLERTTA